MRQPFAPAMESDMREMYDCEVRTWETDSTGKRVLKWIPMSVEKARQRADVTVRCSGCHGPIRLHSPGPHTVSSRSCGAQAETQGLLTRRLFRWAASAFADPN